jgi:hypothetical protein
MATKDWKLEDNKKDYITWFKEGEFTRTYLIAKTEQSRWILFLAIRDGRKILGYPASKIKAIAMAKQYMGRN